MLPAKDNPFAVTHVQKIRYDFSPDQWERIFSRLAELQFRGAIVGPHGAGKSTLLEDLADRAGAAGWECELWRLNRQQPRFPAGFLPEAAKRLHSRMLILLDGAEQLGFWNWRTANSVLRRAGGLVVTVHRPSLLPTLWECSVTPETLKMCLVRLLGDRAEFCPQQIEGLFFRHRGNIREALRAMYDEFALGRGAKCILKKAAGRT